jgi:hypothetical protein
VKPKSRPCAAAKRFPCTRLPTITDAGPTDVSAEDEVAIVEVTQSCNNDPFIKRFQVLFFFCYVKILGVTPPIE